MSPYIVPHQPLSPLRIGAFSAALGLHLVALGLFALPPRASTTAARAILPEVIVADFIARVVSNPAPVPPIPKPPQRPLPKVHATPVAPTVPVLLAESAFVVDAVSVDAESAEIGEVDPAPAVVSRAAQIAYDDASPPPYPAIARRRGWEGTVLLRVRVDEHGRPREVAIERSSGHALLDRSASEHVLARWRFQPALLDGRPTSAWARVPVSFKLQSA